MLMGRKKKANHTVCVYTRPSGFVNNVDYMVRAAGILTLQRKKKSQDKE